MFEETAKGMEERFARFDPSDPEAVRRFHEDQRRLVTMRKASLRAASNLFQRRYGQRKLPTRWLWRIAEEGKSKRWPPRRFWQWLLQRTRATLF